MKSICPTCQAAIPVENVSVENDLAVCPQCAELTSLSPIVAAAAPVGGSIPVSFDIHKVPSGAWVRGTPERFIVGATTRCLPLLLFLVPFTLVWAGGSMGALYGSQIASGKFSPFFSLIGLPFMAGSVMLVTMCLMALAGNVVVEVRSGYGTVFTGVAGIGLTHRFQWDEVDAVFSDVDYSRRRRGQSAIALEGATRIKFGTNAFRGPQILRPECPQISEGKTVGGNNDCNLQSVRLRLLQVAECRFNPRDLALRDSSGCGECWPLRGGVVDFLFDRHALPLLDPSDGRKSDKVGGFEVVSFAVDTHLMLAGPVARWVPGVSDVIGGRQSPNPLAIHQKRDVLDVVVLIAGDHVKDGSAELLFAIFH